MITTDDDRGLYCKYVRADGAVPTGPVFVLEYGKDLHARAALAEYANSCESTKPVLAMDLRAELAKWRMTAIPIRHQPANSDVWRMRFAGHIDLGIRAAGLIGDDLDTARGFDRELTRAFTTYLHSADSDRQRRFLLHVNTIAAHAYAFFAALDHPDLRTVVESILLDLGGLAGVLADSGN